MDSVKRPRVKGQALREAILDEQSACWRRGERPGAEELFERYPELRDDPEAALDVIYQEFLLRRELGECPRSDEFVRRFPFWSDQLIAQFATDAVMRSPAAVTEHHDGREFIQPAKRGRCLDHRG